MNFKTFIENDYAPTDQKTTAFSSFLGTFKKWYDGHRGKWNDVEQAAKVNPKINNFLNHIATQQFSPNIMGRLGDDLEKLVKSTNSNHGYKQYIGSSDDAMITGGDENSAIQNPSLTHNQKQDATKILFNKLKDFEARLKNLELKFQT